ncbi:MAG: molybdopterin-synthase adenylyltransferase MoeB [Litoreibacter sp.]
MVTVLAIAAALWFGGGAFNVSARLRISILIILFTAIILIQATLPVGNSLKEATGGSLWNWVVAGGIAAIVGGYIVVLRYLKERQAVMPQQNTGAQPTFKPEELDRYARHIVLREVGGPGQKKLKFAKVLVIGAGGLGAPVLQYLAAAGVGTIGVVDDDVVDTSNLQRQVIHTDARLGMPKVFSAQEAMAQQNPFVTVKPYNRRLDAASALELFAEYDLILDGTDNFDTRYMVNEVCVKLGKPLISAAITQWEGQISLYHPAENAPCYACAFPVRPDRALAPSCAEAGVMGALPGVVGSMMAVETIKWITDAGETLTGRLMLYDALFAETRVISLKRDPKCTVCGP